MADAISTDFPVLYTRYVEDVYCVFRKDSNYRPFLNKLNALHKNLKYTYKMEGTAMPFLDILVTLNRDGMKSKVFRKPTDTNVLLNNTAVTPPNWKKGLIKCLLHRAEVVCSDDQSLKEEHANLRDIFYQNGYPYQLFDSVKQQHTEKKKNCNSNSSRYEKEQANQKFVLSVPFLGKISTAFGKKLKNVLQSSSGQEI